jgi:hypothetical protein
MKFQNPKTFGHIEEQADAEGRGSIWRACLAVQRSAENKALGNLTIELGYGYCSGKNSNINHLKTIVKDHLEGSKEEFHEALVALKNAIDLVPKKNAKVDARQELWLRLNRLIGAGVIPI